ncbi:MAG: Gfo/Idh/MocA family oxidoreductase [Balneolaceae bacterium]|nr:Gfo/Idh/MocA family oxidoreductase [Balneolaceae bacterium]
MSKKNKNDKGGLNRKDFLKTFSLASLAPLMAGEKIQGKALKEAEAVRYTNNNTDDVVPIGIVGYGEWGRQIASTLERNPKVKIAGISDTFSIMLTRAERSYTDVKTFENYREMLEDPEIPAIIVATPTHKHREVVVDALEAGKHVYCEFPMASSIEDAKAIADAAKEAPRQIFQVGLQYRINPQHRDVFQFIRSGATGRPTYIRSQWHNKTSWRRTSATQERADELNWRLDGDVSLGLIGEIGAHNIDMASWYLNEMPSSIQGFGQVRYWRDGRDVPDNVQVVVEFPSGVHMVCVCSLTTSFDGRYDMFYGSDSTILLRDKHAWMFKEVDAPMLGWEVYARRDRFHGEVGIALVADATQLDAQDVDPFEDDPNVETPLYYSLDSFIDNNIYGPYPAMVGYQQGYNATLVAVKAKEAIQNKSIETLDEDLFALD